MSSNLLFPNTSNTQLDLCLSALLTLQENKDRIISGLSNNRDMQFDIVLCTGVDYRYCFEPQEALCDMLLDYFLDEYDKFSVFHQWEHFSGDVTFVIEGSYDAFMESWKAKELWLNLKRWALVEYLIDCINKELNR